MAKKKNKKQKTLDHSGSVDQQHQETVGQKIDLKSSQHRLHKIIIFCFAFLLYANTITHEYTQDDAIVIYDNMYTTQGFSGISGLLSKDTFFGFFKEEGKANLVSGGRYRPLTPVMFAIEWQFFGNNPLVGHLLNILLYALLCVVLYKVLERLFLNEVKNKYSRTLIFLACLFYAAHPIHTEVVANIKGRDEIMSLMGALSALYFCIKYYDTKKLSVLILAGISFFIGLMSKENAITFLAIIPAALILFRDEKILSTFKTLAPVLIATFCFLIIRTSILGMDFGGEPKELMNNPYLKLVGQNYVPFSGSEKFATILFTLGKYIQLLIFPHPLTHDYYPRHIDIMHFSDWQVILSIIAYISLIGLMFWSLKKNKLISFSIFFFLATLSIVSNIVFPIGTNMSERFMFMPSIGYSLILAYLIERFSSKFNLPKLIMPISLAIIIGLSFKTITRNMVWKSDYSLFTTDVKTSKKSAKMLNAAGGAIMTEFHDQPETPERTKELEKAINYLKEAINIHPRYKNAFLLLGNTHNYIRKYPESIHYYEKALQLDSGYDEAFNNLTITLREAGRYYGEKLKNLEQANEYLTRSYNMKKDDYETVRLLGITCGLQGNHKEAIKYFQAAIDLNPTNKTSLALAYSSLGTAYRNYGDDEMARISIQKAIDLDPKIFNNKK